MLDESLQRDFAAFYADRHNKSHSNLSNLEKNCNQIFVKAPAITREFFEKINNDVVPQKTAFFGYQMNTRRFIVLTGLLLLFMFSTIGTIAMWFTDVYQKRIESEMVLSEDSPTYYIWKSPPIRPKLKIYIFNFTNVEEFESGSVNKLHVQELGPYVYFEEMERVNVRFSKVDGTVSYQEKRNYVFSPELSKGSRDDLVVVPNVPLLAGAALVKNFNFLMRLSYQGILKALAEKPFTVQKAHDFLIGYEDQLFHFSQTYYKTEDQPTSDRFGLLTWKQGLQPDVYTMNTGLHDINKLGQIEKFNGQTHFNMWDRESCDRVQSSNGVIYPMDSVKTKRDLAMFVPQMCRKIPIKFQGEGRILDKVPIYKYKVPLDAMDSVDNTENKCYCNRQYNTCPPKGLFNATECSFMGAPVFYSWPHFYGADPQLFDQFTGLNKRITVNDTFISVHPKFGILLSAQTKLQVNIRIEKSFGVSELDKYPDGLILPAIWFDLSFGEKDLSPDLIDLIYQITFTVRNLELGLKYGFLLATMVTFTCIVLLINKHREARDRTGSAMRPIRIL